MAELVQLDKAASMVGKSEVTLRRLIKANRIPFQKEKTLTGFIYMVDPSDVKTYYLNRDGEVNAATSDKNGQERLAFEGTEIPIKKQRIEEVPIQDEVELPKEDIAPARIYQAQNPDGGAYVEYWQKRAETYEDRYTNEVGKHAQTREELGVWRGRAEQAHSMLLKLLPSGQDVEVKKQDSNHPEYQAQSTGLASWMIPVIVGLITLLILAVIGVVYFRSIAG